MERVALIGPPNSGKTTLFNWLTGRRQKVVNYPGSTVDITVGELLPTLGGEIEIVDTPGSYSLFPKGEDEKIACDTLFDNTMGIRRAIVVMDATQIARQLPLVEQVRDCGFNIVVALTMEDLYRRDNLPLQTERLRQELGVPVVAIDGRLGGGVKELVEELRRLPGKVEAKAPTRWDLARYADRLKAGRGLESSLRSRSLSVTRFTEAVDRVLFHPVGGLLIFVLAMGLLFSSIYWAAAPFMDWVDGFFASTITVLQERLGDGLWVSFLTDGIVAGVGAVMVFVPQILILFLGICFLEDSGYLARAATLIDRPLQKLGLNGKAFVPILSGFACAVPATMAARNINSPRERWIATFIIPLMTCSARLPVYALLIGFLFPTTPFFAGAVLAGLYFSAIIVGGIAAGILNKLVQREKPGFFIMELPIFRWPRPWTVVRNSIHRTKAYIRRTGPIILTLAVFIWAFTTFPNYQAEEDAEKLSTSYAAQLGQWIEPIFEPMGGDWRVGVGLISAFAAREVFVSSMAVVFHAGSEAEDEEGLQASLLDQMRQATWADGTPLFTVASVSALLVFFMIALQCISTVGVAWRETQSWKFAVAQLVSMNLAAYGLAVLTFQLLK